MRISLVIGINDGIVIQSSVAMNEQSQSLSRVQPSFSHSATKAGFDEFEMSLHARLSLWSLAVPAAVEELYTALLGYAAAATRRVNRLSNCGKKSGFLELCCSPPLLPSI